MKAPRKRFADYPWLRRAWNTCGAVASVSCVVSSVSGSEFLRLRKKMITKKKVLLGYCWWRNYIVWNLLMHVDEFQVQSDKLDCNRYEFMV